LSTRREDPPACILHAKAVLAEIAQRDAAAHARLKTRLPLLAVNL